jgi:ribosomal RNA-processing protein 17
MRKQRKQQLEEHVEAINTALRKSVGHYSSDESEEGGEWEGFDDPPDVNYQDEYVDEDKYTTVTVETVGISREGFVSSGHDAGSDEKEDVTVIRKKTNESEEAKSQKRAEQGRKVKEKRPKKKKKKFTYESKVDRKVTRMKERSKNQLQAQARRAKS